MDIQQAATQLLGYLGNNPELISQFAQHPYSTTATAMGTDERISKDDMGQIVAQVAAQATGQDLSSSDRAGVASQMVSQTGGSVHALANALFGGVANAASSAGTAAPQTGTSTAEILAKSVAGGLAARGLATLLTGALGTNKPKAE